MGTKLFVAWFEEEQAILSAVKQARARGYAVHDVYTPYAVHGMDDAMGLRPSRLTWACFAFGLLGLGCAFLLEYWTSVVDWPLNVGGKPAASIPAFVPVAFELTVLFAALGTVATMLFRNRLRPRLDPPAELRAGATDDQFVLALGTGGGQFDERDATALCQRLGARKMRMVEGAS